MRIGAVGVRLGQLQSKNLKWLHSHASSGSQFACFDEISTALFQNIFYRQGDATTVKPQGAYSSLMPESVVDHGGHPLIVGLCNFDIIMLFRGTR